MTKTILMPELVAKWMADFYGEGSALAPGEFALYISNRAALWGAGQELDACCEWLDREGWSGGSRQLRAARRPPTSLKEQALQELDKVDMLWCTEDFDQVSQKALETIRRAIESIPDPS